MPLSMLTHADPNALIIGAQGRLTAVSLNGSSLLVQRNADSEWQRAISVAEQTYLTACVKIAVNIGS